MNNLKLFNEEKIIWNTRKSFYKFYADWILRILIKLSHRFHCNCSLKFLARIFFSAQIHFNWETLWRAFFVLSQIHPEAFKKAFIKILLLTLFKNDFSRNFCKVFRIFSDTGLKYFESFAGTFLCALW